MQPGSSTTSSSKMSRNLAEKNRRMHMTDLFSKLGHLILTRASKVKPPKHVVLDQATTYVKCLQERIEVLERRKEVLLKDDDTCTENQMTGGSISTVVNLRDLDSVLEVNFITGLDKTFMLREVISVLQEEGAEVVTTSYSTVGDRVFYTILSQPIYARIGIDTSRVHERLKKLVLQIIQL